MPPSIATPPPPSPSLGLNVIALISGGKDSLYSILHCIRNGHKVIAIANLHPASTTTINPTKSAPPSSIAPPLHKDHHELTNNNNIGEEKAGKEVSEEDSAEDIDSFMYQTIGWGVIPLYETALGIPLYRAPIYGGAVDTGRVYRSEAADQMADAAGPEEEHDETEALIPLLRRIKEDFPQANAVSAGAILSTYQRTRIENVAGRLGLVPLAWLWQYPVLPAPEERRELEVVSPVLGDLGLLEDMAAVGCEARIIKVASGALDEGFLWGDVAGADGVVRRRIVKGMRRFGAQGEDIRGGILGEGGEYETLAVDGPGFLWKQRIEIQVREVKSGEGGVGYLRLKEARCVPKTEKEVEDGVTPESVRRPALLDEKFVAAFAGLLVDEQNDDGDDDDDARGIVAKIFQDGLVKQIQSENGGLWMVSNITAPEAGPGAAEQMAAIATKIRTILDSSVRDDPRITADIVFTTVLLRSMSDFPLMNSIYVSLFKKPNPPARATVACGDSLPAGVNVMVSMVVDLGPRASRQCLHVQSRSYWAPANIGPYSQAMSIPLQNTERLIYVAGQIPLEPASMEVIGYPTSVGTRSWIEDYSLRAVLSLQHMWRIGLAIDVEWWLGVTAFFTGPDHIATKALKAWKLWEMMHVRGTRGDEEEEDDDPTLDVWDIKYGRREQGQTKPTATSQLPNFGLVQADAPTPAFFAVQVDELPRGSDIEWQGLGYRCEGMIITYKEMEFGRATEVTTNEKLSYLYIEIDKDTLESDIESQIWAVLKSYSGPSLCTIYTARALSRNCCPAQIIPCKSVWGARGQELAVGVVLQRQM